MQSPACLHVQGRTPLDLLSAELRPFLKHSHGEAYAWGSGTNYQLGTGATPMLAAPTRLDFLHPLQVTQIAAAKFHSAAVTASGELYTWGFGRGGRLGEAWLVDHPSGIPLHVHCPCSVPSVMMFIASLIDMPYLIVPSNAAHIFIDA